MCREWRILRVTKISCHEFRFEPHWPELDTLREVYPTIDRLKTGQQVEFFKASDGIFAWLYWIVRDGEQTEWLSVRCLPHTDNIAQWNELGVRALSVHDKVVTHDAFVNHLIKEVPEWHDRRLTLSSGGQVTTAYPS